MNDNREGYHAPSLLEFCEKDSSLSCWAHGKLEYLVREEFADKVKLYAGSFCLVNPTEAELQKMFAYMKQHDIPAIDPESLQLYVRLVKAGVQIVG